MNKRGLIGILLFIILVIAVMVFAVTSIMLTEKKHKDFCKDNGFETHEKASFKWETSVCIKIEDNYRVEKEYDRCGNKYCFIKDDASGRVNE